MKSICFVVVYLGRLPEYFSIWLETCKKNETVDWLIFIDDRTKFNYPSNVEVFYTEFSEIREMVQNNYDFDITLDTPYKLCDYKVAYGEIFADYLDRYDYWGFCDIDLIWGNIRRFYTDDLLNKYVKIGNQGHCTIFRNTEEINSLYRKTLTEFPDIQNHVSKRRISTYKEAFTSERICCTDSGLVTQLFNTSNLPVNNETIYAGLEKYQPAFYLQAMPIEKSENNKRQIFIWDNGFLTRHYLIDNNVYNEEFLYIHFFCRPMKNKIKVMDRVMIRPDVYDNFYGEVTPKLINHYGKKNKLAYYWRVFKQNRKRLSLNKIVSFFEIKYKIGRM